MPTLKESLDYAKKNPNSDYAKKLQQIIVSGQANEKARQEGIDLSVYGVQSAKPQTKQTDKPWWEKTGEEILQVPQNIIEGVSRRASNIASDVQSVPEFAERAGGSPLAYGLSTVRAAGRTAGQIAGGAGDVVGSVISPFIPEEGKKIIGEASQGVNKSVDDILASIPNITPEMQTEIKRGLEDVFNTASLLGGVKVAPSVGKGIKGGVTTVSKGAKEVAEATTEGAKAIATPFKGATQAGGEFLERIPRAISKGAEGLEESAKRRDIIKESTPAVREAIKTNLDDRIIGTVQQADVPTRQAYNKVIDIAEESPTTLGVKKQPTAVGGELAVKQYELINKEKQRVGKQIGDKVKELSKTQSINLTDSLSNLNNTLANQGISISKNPKGKTIIDFSGSKFTPAERSKIEQLYNLAEEGGSTLSPSQIKAKDELFSKLQRESNFEGVGKIMVETPEGAKSLFQVFRETYGSKLDEFSPEIRELNKKYRDLSILTDDIEDSILKTPNFNITKTADPSEFAKVNLRRIFGEAQSSPVYEAVADEMDRLSRTLGYADASPKAVIQFAQELRKLYPETIPSTGFAGGIKSGIGGGIPGAIDYALQIGTPTIIDQRRALRGLLKENFSIPKKSPFIPKNK